jgi:gas vesicle protein
VADKEIVIDVVSKYTDHASQGLNQTGKDAEKVEKELNNLGKKRPRIHIDADDKAKPKIDRTRKEGEGLGKKRWTPKIGVDDEATPKIRRITSAGLKFGKMSFTAAVKIKDFATTKLSDLKAKVFNVKNAVAGAFAAVGIGQTIKTSIDLEVQQQNLESSFEVLLGSKKKAQKRIDDLTTFAGSTPFTRDEIYQASRTLQVFTGNALSTGKGLKMVGDVAAGTNSDFSDVALWVGRMYDGMKNHQTIGEATAALQEMGAISGQDRTKLEALAASNKKISQTWPQAMKAFQKYDGLMEKQSDNLGNLMLGVKSFVTNNVFKKLGKGLGDGISPGLRKFRQWRSENKELIAEMGSGIEKFSAEISGKAVDAVSNLAEKANKLFQSDKFKNASISGKINIAWQEMIGDPFSQWWDSSGKPAIVKKISGIGKDIVKAGGNWFKESLKDLLPGGDKAGIEDYLAGALALKLGSGLFKKGMTLTDLITGGSGNPLGSSIGLMNVSASVVNVNGGLGSGSGGSPVIPTGSGTTPKTTQPTGPTRTPGGLFGLGGSGVTLKNGETVAATGWKAFLGNLGVKLGSGAATAGGAATVGGTSLLGGALGIAGIGSAAGNFINAATTKNKATKKKENYRGGTKLGMVGGGAAAGALVGSAVPIVGTLAGGLIGAGVGGFAALTKGNKAGDHIRKNMDKIKKESEKSAKSWNVTSKQVKEIQKGQEKYLGDNYLKNRKEALKDNNSLTAKSQKYYSYNKDSIRKIRETYEPESEKKRDRLKKSVQSTYKKKNKNLNVGPDKEYNQLTNSVQKAYEENKKNTKQTNVGSKSTKAFSGATSVAGGKVSGLGGMSATAGGKLGTMGSMSLAAGGNLQNAGSSALSLAGALASAASTIASAASTTAAQASAIKSITSGSYLSNSGSSKSGKKKTSKKTSSAPKVQTALPKNGKFFHNAKGSLVRGHIVSELGEEGNEMVIPLSKHRSRALSLWNQAGQILGVTKHAKGGLVGGSSGSGKASSGSGQPVINVGGITISVNASGNDGIVDAIKNSKGEIADAIMQAIADAIGSTASNRTAEVM